MNKEDRKIFEDFRETMGETRDTVIELKTVILGKNHDKGLVGWVDDLDKKVGKIRVVLAVIIGSGFLGGGIVGLVNLLN